ncbi:MAG TPA: hypothetical protein EYP22_10450 [Methanosarcinales archaeon]|nr:hypothetical protein [Methanosarcinales archaeon]
MEEVVRDKLMELTPDKWGLLVELNEKGLIDLQLVREAAHDLAKKRMSVAKEYFELAKQLLENNMQSRSIISRAYYGILDSMFHLV